MPAWVLDRDRRGHGVMQGISCKGNCLANTATEQVFGHLKDGFFRGRDRADSGLFKGGLEMPTLFTETQGGGGRLEVLTSDEFRDQSLRAAWSSSLIRPSKFWGVVQFNSGRAFS